MSEGVIKHEEVLQHVYDFLRAYGYKNALLALQNESRVPYNTINIIETEEESKQNSGNNKKKNMGPINSEDLTKSVLEGHWDRVLAIYVDELLLPEEVMFDLYEQIFEELLILHGFMRAAQAFLINSPIFLTMKRSSPARYARLQQLLDSHKNIISDNVQNSENILIPPHIKQKREELLKVLQDFITWNSETYEGILPAAIWKLQNEGINESKETSLPLLKRRKIENNNNNIVVVGNTNLSSSSSGGGNGDDDTISNNISTNFLLQYPLQCPKIIKEKIVFANSEMPSVCTVSNLNSSDNKNVKYTALIVGKNNGTVDFLNGLSAIPVGNSVGHTDGVLSLTIDMIEDNNNNNENNVTWVGVGYRDGWVKIYNSETRKLVRRFSQIHSSGVTSIVFAGLRHSALGGHHSFIISGSFDGCIHVLDIREGKSIQCIRDAHQSMYILSLCVVSNKNSDISGIVSAGNNGTLCFWCISSENKLEQLGPARSLGSFNISLKEEVPTRLIRIDDTKHDEGEFLILTRSQHVLILQTYFTKTAAEPVIIKMQSLISAPRPLYNGCVRVIYTSALATPIMSIFLTDREGTILLYNIEMLWRVESGVIKQAGGIRKEIRANDESSLIVVEYGKSIGDLNVVNITGATPSLLAYSPSLSTMYILSWN